MWSCELMILLACLCVEIEGVGCMMYQCPVWLVMSILICSSTSNLDVSCIAVGGLVFR